MIGKTVTALTMISLVVGGIYGLNNHLEANYAKKDKLQLTNCRLEQKILDDRLQNAVERKFWYEQQFGAGCVNAPPNIKLECEKADATIDKTQKELEKLPPINLEGY